MKKKLRPKLKNILLVLIFLVFLIIFVISLINIIDWLIDCNSTKDQLKEIDKIIVVEEDDDSDEVEIIEQKVEIPKENPYWDYIKYNLINVDFTELKNKNNDTKGWIQVSGTNINYPFVQTNDNKFYLEHSFNKAYNKAGWVFLDYRNNINTLSKNTIIYAHGRKDTTMFGTLKNILKNGWLSETENHVIKMSTEKENTLWQVFSVYHIPTTSDYIQVEFSSEEEFVSWATMLTNRSSYNFNSYINEGDQVLTLSTCYNDIEKVVLHAKLIKKETR